MKFAVKKLDSASLKTSCIVIAAYTDNKLSGSAKNILKRSHINVKNFYDSGEFKGKNGQILTLHQPVTGIDKVIVLGFGSNKKAVTPKDFRSAIQSLGKAIGKNKQVSLFVDEVDVKDWGSEDKARCCAETLIHANYQFTQCKSKTEKKIAISVVYDSTDLRSSSKGLKTGIAIGGGMNIARELGNLPGNICTPSYLASEARKMSRKYKTVKTTILSEKQMKSLGMGSLLSVSAGSKEPAQLIIMEYMGAAKTVKPHVLVGKGITFDTGGISLKPGPAMDEMKFDMCGAASVFGTLDSIANLAPKMNVVGIVAAAENMPGSQATKPGDIVTSMSGQTIEILNTDAEGRLVLCDALTYAEKFKPQTVVDIATLTGACVIALGKYATGLFSNDDELAKQLLAAGEKTGDRAWHMPLWDEYQSQLDSNFADIANIGGRDAGAITAACFLSRFTKKYQWAHLDIAGAAWHSGTNKGATGRPVPLLTEYLLSR